jgi:DNA-binding phage protein
MKEQIEDELDRVKLKYSDSDVEKILTNMLEDTNYDFMKASLINAFKNYHISKIEREYGKV